MKKDCALLKDFTKGRQFEFVISTTACEILLVNGRAIGMIATTASVCAV
jgi:hypothetical protein